MRIEKIWVDMDGVLCDFSSRYEELFGIAPDKAESNAKFYPYFEHFIKNGHFATLDWYPGGKELIATLNSINVPKEILSSTAQEDHFHDISQQKRTWLNTNNIAYPATFVPGKKHKAKYATPNSILIDDHPKNIEQWNAAGGIGIMHTDVTSTIAMLDMYLD
jgi:uncharacterized HAD superfamily protein